VCFAARLADEVSIDGIDAVDRPVVHAPSRPARHRSDDP
jgi:hypothetical protein